MHLHDDVIWNGEKGAGGISWADRSRMGRLRGVIDPADASGRRNLYMHTLHRTVLERELARAPRVDHALDFGCGTGRLLDTLCRYSASVHAIDREPAMVEAARAYSEGTGAHIACWRDNRLQFEDRSFDFVLCSSVLCVTTQALFDHSLIEIARVARPGATLLLLEQVAPRRGLTLRRYYDALYKAGFEIERVWPIRPAASAFTRIAARHAWIPARCFGTLAALELATVRHSRTALNQSAYVEHALVARRRRD